MSITDDIIRDTMIEACHNLGIEVNSLNVDVQGNVLNVSGSVPSAEQRHNLWSLLETVDARVTDIVCRVCIAPATEPVAEPSNAARA